MEAIRKIRGIPGAAEVAKQEKVSLAWIRDAAGKYIASEAKGLYS